MASDAEILAAAHTPCPDCGHREMDHMATHWWSDGHTCIACRSNPAGLVGAPGRRCHLTSAEVKRAIATGSPACPNHADPVLCKWDAALGRIVPEAGCPLHDLALNGADR